MLSFGGKKLIESIEKIIISIDNAPFRVYVCYSQPRIVLTKPLQTLAMADQRSANDFAGRHVLSLLSSKVCRSIRLGPRTSVQSCFQSQSRLTRKYSAEILDSPDSIV